MRVRRIKRNLTTGNFVLLAVILCGAFYIYKYILLSSDSSAEGRAVQLGQVANKEKPVEWLVMKDGKRTTEQVEYETEAKCGNAKPCVKGQYAFSLSSGTAKSGKIPMCFNGVLSSHEISRGMNVMVIDETNGNIISEDVFDLWGQSSNHFVQFLDGLKTGQVLVISTYDEASKQLSDHAREILHDDFGSKLIKELNYRGSWVFIGQKGIRHNGYYEKVHPKKDNQWGETSTLRGCAMLPLSKNKEFEEQEKGENIGNEEPKEAEESSNICGTTKCDDGTIAVYVHSSFVEGKTKNFPLICVDGKALIYKDGGTGTAGRGLNIVVFDPHARKPVKTVYYDTYDSDTDDRIAAALFQNVKEDHIVVVTTHDEVTRKLGFETMAALRELGSQQINSLGFRTSWAFIGQKKLNGNSPYELVGEVDDAGWGTKVEINECVPLVMKKAKDGSTNGVNPNRKKAEFCKKYDSYGEFCNENLDVPLLPVPIDDASLKSNQAYSTPIIIVSGPDLPELQRTMDSVLKIPGLNNKMVVVVVEESFDESKLLVQLYGFRLEHVKSATTFAGMMHKTMRLIMTLNYFKDKTKFIIIEDRVLVSPDLLHYYSQTLHLLDEDNSIFTISAWNEFGFASTSSDPNLLYRTELFVGYVWVLQRSVWDKEIREKEGECCNQPTWQRWFQGDLMKGREIIAPDVSRLTKRLQDGFYVDKPAIEAYHKDRIATKNTENEPTYVMKLVKAAYEEELKHLIHSSLPMENSALEQCLNTGAIDINHSEDSSYVYSVFYEADSAHSTLIKLCNCFHLYVHKGTEVRNIHNGLVRFTVDKHIYLLIGSTSEYYKLKPDDVIALKARS